MLASVVGRLSRTLVAWMSASCWSRSRGWKNVITRSEFWISGAEWSNVNKNFLTSGNRLSATVLMLERPTDIPVCKLDEKTKVWDEHGKMQIDYLCSLASGNRRQSFWCSSQNSLNDRNRYAGSGSKRKNFIDIKSCLRSVELVKMRKVTIDYIWKPWVFSMNSIYKL